MDVNALKGRIAEALVEGIFRRAEYQVALVGRESRVQHLIKIGPDEFLPDLLVWKPVGTLHRLVAIEVKYRAHIENFLLQDPARLSKAVRQWPTLYFVFVTDNPETGRSCFQAIDMRQYTPDKPAETTDLHDAGELGIWSRNAQEHEGLVKLIFPLLNSLPRVEGPQRKPGAKVTGHALRRVAGDERSSSKA
jgi:hypothetical protein